MGSNAKSRSHQALPNLTVFMYGNRFKNQGLFTLPNTAAERCSMPKVSRATNPWYKTRAKCKVASEVDRQACMQKGVSLRDAQKEYVQNRHKQAVSLRNERNRRNKRGQSAPSHPSLHIGHYALPRSLLLLRPHQLRSCLHASLKITSLFSIRNCTATFFACMSVISFSRL